MRRWTRALPLLILALSKDAFAWDPEMHVAVFEAARLVSPVIDSRFDTIALQDVLAGLREPDPSDRSCLYHRGTPGRKEAFTYAEELLGQLRAPYKTWGPRQKARAFGAYLHYVADSVAPAVAIREQIRSMPYDLAVYREKAPLQEPLGTALKERGASVLASESGLESLPGAFRAAVNACIDAALRAPLIPGAREPEDVGPVLMVPVMIVAETVSDEYVETPRLLHAGLHVLEWSARRTEAGSVVRALVLNNLDFCVRHAFFRLGGWVGGLTVSLPPGTLNVVELPGPAGSPDDVVTRFVPGDCPADGVRMPIPLSWLRLAASDRMQIQFDKVREFKPGQPGPKLFGRAFAVEFLESDLAAMKGLEVPEFHANAANDRVDFRFRMRNRSDRSSKPLYLELEVASTAQPVTELVEIKVDLKSIRPGEERTIQGSLPVRTHGETTALRLYRIRRDAPPSQKAKTVKW
jgi:hypothetical protein